MLRKYRQDITFALGILSLFGMFGTLAYSATTESIPFFWAGWALLIPTIILIMLASYPGGSTRVDLGLGIEDDLGLNPPRRAKAKVRARRK